MEEVDHSSLSLISPKHFDKFVHHVIDSICSGVLVSQKQFEECPIDQFWLAVQCTKKLIKDISRGKISKDEITNHLSPLGKEVVEHIFSAISMRKEEIKKVLVRDLLKDVEHLKDFDWNVRLAVASDKILDFNESIFTLHLHTSAASSSRADSTLSMEMSAEQLDKLIEQLKAAQERVTQVSHRKNL